MADLKWADVAHHYTDLLCEESITKVRFTAVFFTPPIFPMYPLNAFVLIGGKVNWMSTYKPILRHLEDMTQSEVEELVLLTMNNRLEEPMSLEEIDVDRPMIGDRGSFMDADVSMVISFTARCFCGHLVVIDGGGVVLQDSDADTENPVRVGNAAEILHFFISKGFDVFGIIESGQAIRKGVEG